MGQKVKYVAKYNYAQQEIMPKQQATTFVRKPLDNLKMPFENFVPLT
jgi:hypothetical protein